MTWDPHRTARQKAKAQSPLARKLNKAAVLAPVQRVEPVLCVACTHPRLIHRDNQNCLRVGCDCASYVEAP